MKKAVSPSPLSLLPERRRFWTIFAVFMVALWFGLLYIFHGWLGIDISFSQVFFQTTTLHERNADRNHLRLFPMNRQPLYIIVRKFLISLPIFLFAVFLSITSINAWRHRKTTGGEKVRRYALTLLIFPVGSGLLVNCFLKSFSGRPRPYQTDLFGGHFSFEPAGSFAEQCDYNRSFLSGESAAAPGTPIARPNYAACEGRQALTP